MIMYLMLRGFVIDDHASITLTSLSLFHRFVYVLYIRTLFLLLNASCCACLRQVTLLYELLYILGFEMYTVSMTLVDAT
jgi:hypothetical protein